MDFKSKVIKGICAELIGTFLICSIFLSGSKLKSLKTNRNGTIDFENDHQLNKLSIKNDGGDENVLAFGLLLTSAVTYTIQVSGGQLNPAVTLGALVCGYIKIIPAICYIIAQIVGALLGELSATLVAENTKQDKVKTEASAQFAVEFLASFLLVSVYLSVVDYRTFGNDVGSAPLTIGLTAAMTMALTRCRLSVNLAISLAKSVHPEEFIYDWVYWVAPLLGGLVAGIIYRILTQVWDSPLVRVDLSKSLVTIKV